MIKYIENLVIDELYKYISSGNVAILTKVRDLIIQIPIQRRGVSIHRFNTLCSHSKDESGDFSGKLSDPEKFRSLNMQLKKEDLMKKYDRHKFIDWLTFYTNIHIKHIESRKNLLPENPLSRGGDNELGKFGLPQDKYRYGTYGV